MARPLSSRQLDIFKYFSPSIKHSLSNISSSKMNFRRCLYPQPLSVGLIANQGVPGASTLLKVKTAGDDQSVGKTQSILSLMTISHSTNNPKGKERILIFSAFALLNFSGQNLIFLIDMKRRKWSTTFQSSSAFKASVLFFTLNFRFFLSRISVDFFINFSPEELYLQNNNSNYPEHVELNRCRSGTDSISFLIVWLSS